MKRFMDVMATVTMVAGFAAAIFFVVTDVFVRKESAIYTLVMTCGVATVFGLMGLALLADAIAKRLPDKILSESWAEDGAFFGILGWFSLVATGAASFFLLVTSSWSQLTVLSMATAAIFSAIVLASGFYFLSGHQMSNKQKHNSTQ
ncbi:MAG: hypothetical protein JWO43_640 [Candidatus Adlerbacteria bacterium]|nr:hypothetical protein [Candidatus Adlerbacteria bacterium]